ncbi:hypothetical protein [Devosia sp. 2618]|uniref:hypothetical protein n=1 Tax=Devosia sp. 2618 TaxID=3156454 RepID=UPI00339282DF
METFLPILFVLGFVTVFALSWFNRPVDRRSSASYGAYRALAARRGWTVSKGKSPDGYSQTVFVPETADWSLVIMRVHVNKGQVTYDTEWFDPAVRFAEGNVMIGPLRPRGEMVMAEKIMSFAQTPMGKYMRTHNNIPPGLKHFEIPGPNPPPLSILSDTEAFTKLPLREIADFSAPWEARRPGLDDRLNYRIGPNGLAVRLWKSPTDVDSVEALIDLGLASRRVFSPVTVE